MESARTATIREIKALQLNASRIDVCGPGRAEDAKRDRRQALDLRCGITRLVMLSRPQRRFAWDNLRAIDGIDFAISTRGWIRFRPAQLTRWMEVLDALLVLRPSKRRTIEAIRRKLQQASATEPYSKKGK
jgi:hypothetical protein